MLENSSVSSQNKEVTEQQEYCTENIHIHISLVWQYKHSIGT